MSTPWNFSALPAHIHYAIGVDGGGTNTRARVLHRSGKLVGEGKAGASGLMQGIPQAWQNIWLAIDQATRGRLQPDWPALQPANITLGLGLAGANNGEWRREFLLTDPGYARLELASDADTALSGAHHGQPGVLVILGTGAVGLAALPDGSHRTSGGWGFPSGDEGSGSDLGRLAVSLTQRAVDGRTQHSPLTRDVYATVGGTPDAMLAWCCRAHQFEYASLAQKVFDHEADDPHAAQILQHAVHSLEQLVASLDATNTLPLVLAGSIAQRLVGRLSPAIATRVVAAQGDAMDGGLALCFS